MKILLVGRYEMFSRFIESHILTQNIFAEVHITTPWELQTFTGTYDLVILNNIHLKEHLSSITKLLRNFVQDPSRLIFLDATYFFKTGENFTFLSPEEDLENFNRLLTRAASESTGESRFLSTEEFLGQFTLVSRDRETLNRLTMRQINIIKLLLAGLSYQDAADRMGVSINTIKKHMGSVYKKTGLKNRAELIQLFRNVRLGRRKEDWPMENTTDKAQ